MAVFTAKSDFRAVRVESAGVDPGGAVAGFYGHQAVAVGGDVGEGAVVGDEVSGNEDFLVTS